MRPDESELDAEIRGHLAISVKERLERGDDPESARQAALREFGNVTLTRESMRAVWRPRWLATLGALALDLRIARRSLRDAGGLTFAVIVTLALGIGANAAIFSVVREVLLRPLVNRDADRLLYIRQRAPGLRAENTTFSIPEINDFKSRVTAIETFGDFSTLEFSLVGLGEPRLIRAGVVGGSYFEVMGLRPMLGRLLTPDDDGPEAEPVAVLTHRFWMTALDSDPAVVGRTVRLGARDVRVVGVVEPSVPYPIETEVIANVVTSSHHLEATMVTMRTHRMTELFGRLKPGATFEEARAELHAAHAAMMREHPDAYASAARMELLVLPLRDQLAAPARRVLLLLLAAAGLVFVVACSNAANLILARSVRRESELAVRAALGATTAALRRTLLAESLILCGAGALLGVLLAKPLATAIGRYAAPFSVRALDATVDATLLWIGGGLAITAALVLAYVPRLPSAQNVNGLGLASGAVRITPGAKRRLSVFAVVQMALSFVLLAGAGALLSALVNLQNTATGLNMRQVLALDVPLPIEAAGPRALAFVQEVTGRIRQLPEVERVAAGNVVPWRDAERYGAGSRFAVENYTPARGENPHGRVRNVTPGYFSALGIPFLAGRDFGDGDVRGNELVVIVSESVARRFFPPAQALGGRLWWTDPYFGPPAPRRIVGIVADVDDEHIAPEPALTIYHPVQQVPFVDRLFVQTSGDPYALVAPVRRIIREIAADQPVEHPATLADVRAEVLAPERLNAFVFTGFAAVALLIAVVGVAGVLALTVSARKREFGVRLAIGAPRRRLLFHVLSEGLAIAGIGIACGAVGGYALGRAATSFESLQFPGFFPILGAGAALIAAAAVASLMPAARASRVDVIQALRSE